MGIILFLLSVLSFVHASFGWLLTLPITIKKLRLIKEFDMEKISDYDNLTIKIYLGLQSIIVAVSFIFMVLSLIFINFKFLKYTSLWSLNNLLIFIGIFSLLFIAHILFLLKMQKRSSIIKII